MTHYQHKDHYYKKAKEKGLPSRASFKIEEILGRFPILRPGDKVLDLGAAPGGWTVVLCQTVGPQGKVLAIDLQALKIPPHPNLIFLQKDVACPETKEWLHDQLGKKKLACICSDLSPKLSGIPFRDAYLSFELGLMVFELAKEFLEKGGHLVTKQFPGEEFHDYLKTMRRHFKKVKVFEPKSTRKTSREVYVLGMDFSP